MEANTPANATKIPGSDPVLNDLVQQGRHQVETYQGVDEPKVIVAQHELSQGAPNAAVTIRTEPGPKDKSNTRCGMLLLNSERIVTL